MPSKQVMDIRFDGKRALVTGAGKGTNAVLLSISYARFLTFVVSVFCLPSGVWKTGALPCHAMAPALAFIGTIFSLLVKIQEND